jgi:hypothetical protein
MDEKQPIRKRKMLCVLQSSTSAMPRVAVGSISQADDDDDVLDELRTSKEVTQGDVQDKNRVGRYSHVPKKVGIHPPGFSLPIPHSNFPFSLSIISPCRSYTRDDGTALRKMLWKKNCV